MPTDEALVLEWIRRFAPPVNVVYESGPTGFALARYLRAAGISCVVAAYSKLLRAPGDRIKTYCSCRTHRHAVTNPANA